MLNYLKLLRPKHWIKNGLVFAPLLFASQYDLKSIIITFIGFICFCLIASCIYIINDVVDYNLDKTNPLKQDRPIASGKISTKCASVLAYFLFLISAIICYFLPLYFTITLGVYAILNLAYIFKLKEIVLIDVLCLSISFILRIIAGGYLACVDVTKWILVMGFFLALFLGFAKRRGEVLQENITKRKVALIYKTDVLDKFIMATGMLAVICYALFTLDTSVIEKFSSPHLFYTIIFPVYGIFRYIMLIPQREDTDPTNILYTDKTLIVCVLLWLVATLSIINYHL